LTGHGVVFGFRKRKGQRMGLVLLSSDGEIKTVEKKNLAGEKKKGQKNELGDRRGNKREKKVFGSHIPQRLKEKNIQLWSGQKNDFGEEGRRSEVVGGMDKKGRKGSFPIHRYLGGAWSIEPYRIRGVGGQYRTFLLEVFLKGVQGFKKESLSRKASIFLGAKEEVIFLILWLNLKGGGQGRVGTVPAGLIAQGEKKEGLAARTTS